MRFYHLIAIAMFDLQIAKVAHREAALDAYLDSMMPAPNEPPFWQVAEKVEVCRAKIADLKSRRALHVDKTMAGLQTFV